MKKQFNPAFLFLLIIGISLFFIEEIYLINSIIALSMALTLGLLINYMKSRTVRLYKIASILGAFFIAHYLVVIMPASSLAYLFFLVPITLASLIYHCKGGLVTYLGTLVFLLLELLNTQNLIETLEKTVIISLFTLTLVYFVLQKQKLYFQNGTWLINLHRKVNELSLMRDVTISMQSAKNNNELHNIILTALTAGYGLGYNRAAIFLYQEGILHGKYAIGPRNKKEAYRIWGSVVAQKTNLFQVMDNQEHIDLGFMDNILNVVLDPLKDTEHPLIKCFLSQKPQLVSNGLAKDFGPLMENLEFENYAMVPILNSGEGLGVIIVDNRFNEKPISEEDLDTLMTFAHQSALALENNRLYNEISVLAITDELTKLYNHRHFKNQIEYYLKNQMAFTLMVIDVNNFKLFNENFGHKMGDLVLSKVGEALKRVAFKKGMAFRYGGDEFTMIFPGLSIDDAQPVAYDIQTQIKSEAKKLVNHSLTVSIGLSSYPLDGTDETQLFIKADQNMQEVKSSGKNLISGEVASC